MTTVKAVLANQEPAHPFTRKPAARASPRHHSFVSQPHRQMRPRAAGPPASVILQFDRPPAPGAAARPSRQRVARLPQPGLVQRATPEPMPGRPTKEYVVVPPALAYDGAVSDWGPQVTCLCRPASRQEAEKERLPMPHAEHTVTINRSAGDVFDYLADGTHNRDWRNGVLEIEKTTAASGAGAGYTQVLAGPGGRRIPGDYRVTTRRGASSSSSPPARPARPAYSSSPRIRTTALRSGSPST
jgi:hypothetical protein